MKNEMTQRLPYRAQGLPGISIRNIASFCLALFASAALGAATISEPATTFYGKVLGTGDLQPFLITEGSLTWTLRRADGVDVTLKAALFSFGGGAFSYRLDVPHSALALGLSASAAGVPLTLAEQTHRHVGVTLDGDPATLLGPAGEVFTTAQLLRSATYRLDLGVARHAVDTDGDGLPDWWEDLHGLDKQANDAGQVFGTGGLTAAQAYALGLDPRADHTVPVLTTPETVVYAGGATALILDAHDLDTPASNLVYTVAALPFGALALLSPDDAPTPLEAGATFTQEDVRQARLIYQHGAEINDPGVLSLALADGQHDPVTADVRLLLYEPAINEVSVRSDLYQLANAGFVVAEGDDVDASGAAVAYALTGSDLSGGAADDVLIAAAAARPSSLGGGPGADRFVFTDFAARVVTITDFSVAEGDTLDITAFAPGAGTLSDHVTLEQNALVFDTGLTVVLNGLDGADLYALAEAGALLSDVPLAARVVLAATVPTAYRNSRAPGVFTVTRQGDASRAVTVNLLVSGSAGNGTDYEAILNTVVIPAGAASADVRVTPYESGGALAVVASLRLLAGPGYVLGAAQTASVTIEPHKTQVYVEALLPIAAQESAESGFFLVWRDSAGTTLAVQNTLGGDAVRGGDYLTYNYDTGLALNPTLLSFGANETEKLIEVAVKPSADLSAGPKTVTLAPVPSTRYFIDPELSLARIALIGRYDTFEDWLARNGFGYQALSTLEDGAQPSREQLLRLYAFGGEDGFPRPLMDGGKLHVTVRQRVGLLDVGYGVRGFTDLLDPVGSAVPVEVISSDLEWKTYRLDTDGPRGFISVDLK
jgi:hypothetical protein